MSVKYDRLVLTIKSDLKIAEQCFNAASSTEDFKNIRFYEGRVDALKQIKEFVEGLEQEYK